MRKSNRLTNRGVEAAPPGRHSDGGGLILNVGAGGSRSWVFRYQYRGRRHDLGLGPWPTVKLADARARAGELRQGLVRDEDPLALRLRQKAERLTFAEAARQLIEQKRSEWSNAKHAAQWTSTLEAYVFPTLGPLDVAQIGTAHVLHCLEPIWTGKPETASRVRQRIEAVLDYATARGSRSGDNPARWKGHLETMLAKPTKVRRREHFPALPWRDMPAFMGKLRQRTGAAALALEFLVLTASRSRPIRLLEWRHLDLEQKVWIAPAGLMKMAVEHRVPLGQAALDVLKRAREEAPPRSDADLVFPGARQGRPLSDMSLTAVLKRMKRDDVTVHGFRSTFTDWAHERTAFPQVAVDQALAHAIGSKVEAAYRRGDLFDKRRRLMDAWAGYCASTPTAAAVVPIRAGA